MRFLCQCRYGRLMHIVGYADLGTKIFMEKHRQRAFLLLRKFDACRQGVI